MADIFGNILAGTGNLAGGATDFLTQPFQRGYLYTQSLKQQAQQARIQRYAMAMRNFNAIPDDDPNKQKLAPLMNKYGQSLGLSSNEMELVKSGIFGGGAFGGISGLQGLENKKITQKFDRLGQPAGFTVTEKDINPNQQIAQQKLILINRLQKKVMEGMATNEDKAKLDKLLVGQPMVQIGLGKPASASERTAIAETRASIDALNNLKELFDNPRVSTGPLVGRYSPTAGLMGLTSDEQEAFMAATSAFKNKVIKEITGAQMSEVEAKRIMKQIPDITDPPTRWKAKWQQTKRNLQAIQRRRTEVLKQSGIQAPEGQVEVDIKNISDEELKRIAGIK